MNRWNVRPKRREDGNTMGNATSEASDKNEKQNYHSPKNSVTTYKLHLIFSWTGLELYYLFIYNNLLYYWHKGKSSVRKN